MNTYVHNTTSVFRTAARAGLLALSLFMGTSALAAPPAFEAYYKFYLGNTHAGFVIQRLEVIDAKKEMISTSYSYVKTPTGTSIESLAAHAGLDFEPVSYSYNSLSDGKPKNIEATFKQKKMTAKITELVAGNPGEPAKARSKTVSLQVPQNGFLSAFLNYVMLKNGLTPGKSYTFYALSEEDPGFHQGTADIVAEEVKNKIDSFKINIKFKDIPFTAYVTSNGEPLGTLSELQGASTEMVATRAEAVGSFPFNEKQIKTLFGAIPEGKNNKMHRPDAPAASPAQPPTKAVPLMTDKPKGQ